MPRLARNWPALVAGLLTCSPALAIVHGKVVNQPRFLDEFPWAVAIANPVTGGVCTGVLVSPSYVLTAAHCTGAGKQLLVGNTSRRRARSIAVAAAIRHPGHSKETQQFDVGLLRLAEPVDLRPLRLISEGEYRLLVKPAAPAAVMGWGKRPDSGYSDRLVHARVNLHKLGMQGTQIIYEDRGAPCGGDSGGPLVMEGLDGEPVLLGIASATDGNLCATGGGFAIYINVIAVRRFIEEHVPDLER